MTSFLAPGLYMCTRKPVFLHAKASKSNQTRQMRYETIWRVNNERGRDKQEQLVGPRSVNEIAGKEQHTGLFKKWALQ